MISKKLLLLSAAALASFAAPANAANYVFDVLYSGGGIASLATGSDDPTAVTLAAGDTYTYKLRATGNGQWTTLADGDIFPFFSLYGPFGYSFADFTIDLRNNGTTVLSQSALNEGTCCAHLGTNRVFFSGGLVYDEYKLISTIISTPATGPAISLLPYSSAPEIYTPSLIAFSAGGAVPEPATWAMMIAGFAVTGALMRRRRQKVSVRFA